MQISKNSDNRFDITLLGAQKFEKKGKQLQGIAGHHGGLGAVIGFLLEKIFHKTVSVKGEDETYYFNCKSLSNYFKRQDPNAKCDVHDPKAVESMIKNLITKKHGTLSFQKFHNSLDSEDKKQLEAMKDSNPTEYETLRQMSPEKLKEIETNIADEKNQITLQQQKAFHDRLYQACNNGDIEECKKIFAQGASAAVENYQASLLCRGIGTFGAKGQAKLDLCELLLAHGADIKERDYQDNTPIEAGVKTNDPELVRWLINKGADINVDSSLGRNRAEGTKGKSLYEFAKEKIWVSRDDEVGSKNKETILKLLNPAHELISAAQETQPPKVDSPVKTEKLNDEELKANKETSKEALQKNLLQACRTGDLEGCKKLFSKGANAKTTIEDYRDSFLKMAIRSRLQSDEKIELCERLLTNGAEVNERDYTDVLPIEVAIKENDLKMMQWLISKGADLTLDSSIGKNRRTNTKGKSLYDFAFEDAWTFDAAIDDEVIKDRKTILEILKPKQLTESQIKEPLLTQDSSSNTSTNSTPLKNEAELKKATPLTPKEDTVISESSSASQENQLVNLCLGNRFNEAQEVLKKITIKDEDSISLLRAVMMSNADEGECIKMCELLLSKGAQLDRKDDSQATPLEQAIRETRDQVAIWLINKGANISLPTSTDSTLIKVTQAVINMYKNNPAAQKKAQNILAALTLKSATTGGPSNVNESQVTLTHALSTACREGNLEECKKIFEKGTPPNMSPSLLRDGLDSKASSQDKEAICELLLKNGADLDEKDSENLYPLEIALNNKDLDMVLWLMRNGADPFNIPQGQDKPLALLITEQFVSSLSDYVMAEKIRSKIVQASRDGDVVREKMGK